MARVDEFLDRMIKETQANNEHTRVMAFLDQKIQQSKSRASTYPTSSAVITNNANIPTAQQDTLSNDVAKSKGYTKTDDYIRANRYSGQPLFDYLDARVAMQDITDDERTELWDKYGTGDFFVKEDAAKYIENITGNYKPVDPYAMQSDDRRGESSQLPVASVPARNADGRAQTGQNSGAALPEVAAAEKKIKDLEAERTAVQAPMENAYDAWMEGDDSAYDTYMASRSVFRDNDQRINDEITVATRRRDAVSFLYHAQSTYGIAVRYDPTQDLSDVSVEDLEAAAEEANDQIQTILGGEKEEETRLYDAAYATYNENVENGLDWNIILELSRTDPAWKAVTDALGDAYGEPSKTGIKDVEDLQKIYTEGYKDTIIGQYGANRKLGRLTQDVNLAANEFLDHPTEANWKHVQRLQSQIGAHTVVNATALDDIFAVAPIVTKEFAQYAPQFWDQQKASFAYGAMFAVPGILSMNPAVIQKLYNAGAILGSGAYSYKTMRGAAYLSLLELGVDHETAKRAATDEAYLSSIIEMFDTALTMVLTGGNKAIASAAGVDIQKGLAKKFNQIVLKTTAKLAGFGVEKAVPVTLFFAKGALNGFSEGVEEGTQEAVSIANERRAVRGETGFWGLFGDAWKIYVDYLKGDLDEETTERIRQNQDVGAHIGWMMFPVGSGASAVVSRGGSAIMQNIAMHGITGEVRNTISDALISAGADATTANDLTPLVLKVVAGETVTNAEAMQIAQSDAAVAVLTGMNVKIDANATVEERAAQVQQVAAEQQQAAQAEQSAPTVEGITDESGYTFEQGETAPTVRENGAMGDAEVVRSNTEAKTDVKTPQQQVAEVAKTMGQEGAAALTENFDGTTATDAEQYVEAAAVIYRYGKDMAAGDYVAPSDAVNAAFTRLGTERSAALYRAGVSDGKSLVYGTENEYNQNSTIKEDGINGGKQGQQTESDLQREGRIRDLSQSEGGEHGSVSAGTEEVRRRWELSGAPKDSQRSSLRFDEEVNPQSFLRYAKNGQTVYRDVSDTKSVRNGHALAAKNGLRATAWGGGEIQVEGSDNPIRGFTIVGTNEIGAQTDNVAATYEDIILHEIMEQKLLRGEVTVDGVLSAAEQYVDAAKIQVAVDFYHTSFPSEGVAGARSELVCDGGDHINQLRYAVDSGALGGDYVQLADLLDEVVGAIHRAANELTNGAFELDGETFDGEVAQTQNAAEEGGARYSRYLYPKLNQAEWALLNRTLEREIESSDNFLDKSTKWAYKQERGVSIFAIYGIGDGTVPTPLYAVGGEQANQDFELLQKHLEARKNGSNRSRSTLIRLLESIESKRGDTGNRVYHDEKGRTADGDVPVSRGQRERNGRADHERSTEDRGQVKFSMKLPVEQTGTLVALHNLSADKLDKALSLGGFPMPSIAVTKSTIPHTNFGDITLVMNRSTIDPQADRRNTVYSADAWTPTFPRIEYEADEAAERRVREKYDELYRKFHDKDSYIVQPFYEYGSNLEDALNRFGGVEGIIERERDNPDMMKLFLLDTGKSVPDPVANETVERLSDETIAYYDKVIAALGEDALREAKNGDGSFFERRKAWLNKYGDALLSVWREELAAQGFSETEIENVIDNETSASLFQNVSQILRYLDNGAETRTTKEDFSATRDAIRKATDPNEYEAWLHGLFDGAEKRTGVYNGRDLYTASGNRRSFEQTHYPATLENIARAMAARNNGNSRNVAGFYGVKTLRASMAKRFASIAEMHEVENRLQNLPYEEVQKINDALAERLENILEKIYQTIPHGSRDNRLIEMDYIGNNLMEITEQREITIDSVKKVLGKYRAQIGNPLAAEIRDLLFDISQMPVYIFEAKPERAVKFDEVLAAVVPSGTSSTLVQRLKDAGVQNVVEYEKGNVTDRLAKVNGVEGAKFSRRLDMSVKKIVAQMSDEERYEALKDRVLTVSARADNSRLLQAEKSIEKSVAGAHELKDAEKKRLFKKLGEEFNLFHSYENDDVELAFTLSKGNMDESTKKQAERYEDYAKLLTCFDEVIENAIGVEVHNRNDEGYKPDASLANVYVLFSAFEDGDRIVPVKLEVKEFLGTKTNTLHLAITLHGIEKSEIVTVTNAVKDGQANTAPSLNISIADLFRNINPEDESFLKYVPKQFFQDETDSLKASRRFTSLESLQEENRELREKLAEYRDMGKELAKAKRRAAYLEGQMKRTETPSVRKNDVAALAKRIVSGYESTLKPSEIAAQMEELGNLIVRGFAGDEELTWEGVKERAYTMARRICENAETLVNPDSADYYAEIKTLLREKQLYVTRKDMQDIADYKEWRKHLPGYINLKYVENENGGNVDQFYSDTLQADYPWLFPDVNGAAAKLEAIVEAMDSLGPIYANPYTNSNMAEAIEYCANEIVDSLIDEGVRLTAPTFADRQAQKLTEQKMKDDRKLANLREQKNARIAEIRKEGQRRTKEALARVRADRNEKLAALKQHYEEIAADRRARRIDSEARTRLLKIARRLKNRKLPRATKALIQQYIGDLDLVAKSMTGASVEKLTDLREWYENQKERNPDFIPDSRVEELLKRLSRRKISELSADEVADLTTVLLNIENEIRTQRELIDSQVRHDTYVAGETAVADIEGSGGKPRLLDKLLINDVLTPLRLMHRLVGYVDSDPLYIATQELADGQRKMMDYQRRANKPFEKYLQDKAFVASIAGKKAKAIKITGMGRNGKTTVEITPAMRMSLFLHSKNEQNMRHIAYGGVTIPDIELYRKGKIAEAYAKGVTLRLTPTEIGRICADMTPQERAFARQISEYFNGQSRDELNETSEKLKGYAVAEVENYFPIYSDKDYLASDFEKISSDGVSKVVYQGFLQERIEGAVNPITLWDANDVLTKSIRLHSRYAGLAIPIRNFSKIWGVTTGEYNEDGRREITTSVTKAVKEMWGTDAFDAVEKLMADLAGNTGSAEKYDTLYGKMRSNYAAAVLELNAGVAVKQAASYPTAAAVVGYRPLLRALTDGRKVNTKFIEKYTPLLWYRSLGYSVQETGEMAERGKPLPKALNWIQKVDVATTTTLWKAAEYSVRDTQKDLKIGTEEYYRAVADVYNRIIEETQPNYTTMQRGTLLRSRSQLARSLAMFKTQPFQNFNILYDALGNLNAKRQAFIADGSVESKQAYESAKRDAVRAVTSQLLSSLVFASMQMAWDLLRGKGKKYKDDDDEMTAASIAKGLGLSMLSNGAGMLPGLQIGLELVEAITDKIIKKHGGEPFFDQRFYGFEESVLGVINDVGNDIIGVSSATGEKLARKSFELICDLAGVAGIPVENATKTLETVARNVMVATSGKYVGGYLALRMTTATEDSAEYYDLLYRAYVNDPAAYEKVYQMMIDAGFEPKKIKDAMEKRMKNKQGVLSVDDLDQRYLSPTQQKEYDDGAAELKRSGLWGDATQEQRDKAADLLYELVVGSNSAAAKSARSKIEGGASVGIDQTEYLLYKLALEMYDENGNGSFDQKEAAAAVGAMTGLTDAERAYLWQSTNSGWSDKNNPYR